MELTLEENKHDMLKVVIAGVPPSVITEYIGKPVYSYLDFGVNNHEFCGYVASVEPVFRNKDGIVNGSLFQEVTLICMGASYAMRAKKNRVWQNQTVDQIVSTIADEHRFSFSCAQDSFIYERIVQTEESDWQFLNKLAQLYGLCFSLHGTHIHFWNPMRALGRGISYHKLRNVIGLNMSTRTTPATILSMRGVFGDTINPITSHTVTAVSVDNRGLVYSGPTFDEHTGFGKEIEFGITDQISINATSALMVDHTIKARSRGINTLVASVELTGTAGALPGGVVSVSEFDSTFDGLWYIKSVIHTITRDEFFTKMTISSENTNDEEPVMSIKSQLPVVPRPAFFNGVWCATTQLKDIYV
jgi:phage protein D